MDAEETDEQVGIAAPELDSLVGSVLDGKYRIEALVAEGAMGRVYRAHHLTMERRVAVKTMHLHLLRSTDAVERFKREAAVCAGLTHPNIVRVYEIGRAHV